MAHGSLPLPVQLYLLAYDTTKPRLTATLQLPFLVRAAALTELVQCGLLTERDGAVRVVDDACTGDPVLDGVLELIAASRPRPWRAWVAVRSGATLDAVRRQLVLSGYLRGTRRRALGVFAYTEYELDRAGFVEDLRAELRWVLHGSEPVDEVSVRDAALLSLAAAGGLRTVVGAGERRTYRERIEQLAERSAATDPAPRAIVREVRRAMVLAIASVTGGAPS
ncbi:GPP34 family phosphoprotein [Streptomyces sp. TRM66268-LWL]|uniref:GPP34 family phosphoprotein n=1 Tax=Streptomyces polyasparticus TaxID=2767826 RepID=A0ABR7SDM8_9ACTN|nr:GPP34 family phosphoprotein [Streptomyces polyasparticus]MBC9713602.1 GPP34 family phosphoprotein [Streptomyces polyasparticus]